jgi:hypothetical protein
VAGALEIGSFSQSVAFRAAGPWLAPHPCIRRWVTSLLLLDLQIKSCPWPPALSLLSTRGRGGLTEIPGHPHPGLGYEWMVAVGREGPEEREAGGWVTCGALVNLDVDSGLHPKTMGKP